MHAARDQTGDMRHVHQEPGADLLRDPSHALEVELARISRTAGYKKLRAYFLGDALHLVVIDDFRFRIDIVIVRLEPAARQVPLHAVGEMPTRGEVERKHLVARLEKQEKDGEVRLIARVGLD